MSFREVKRRSDDARHVAWGWLREFFLEDWTLKLLAMLITLGLWYGVTGQRTPATERWRNVPLEFLLPENVEIGSDPVEEVDVTLEGSQSRLDEIKTRNLVARADITQLKPGDRVARLTRENVRMDLPEGIRVVEIIPRSITLQLEPVVVREVEVEARFEGNLPEGFARGGVQSRPAGCACAAPKVTSSESRRSHRSHPARRPEGKLRPPAGRRGHPGQPGRAADASVSVRVEIVETWSKGASPRARAFRSAGPEPASVSVTLRGRARWSKTCAPRTCASCWSRRRRHDRAPPLAAAGGAGPRRKSSHYARRRST